MCAQASEVNFIVLPFWFVSRNLSETVMKPMKFVTYVRA